MHILIFIVVLCYSVISPLVIIPGVVYFGMAWLVYKNQLLYVYTKQSEANGKHWLMAYKRSVIGLGLFQFLTAGLLSAKKAPYAAIVCGALMPFTYLFHLYCESCFQRHDMVVPLEHLTSHRYETKKEQAIMLEVDEELIVQTGITNREYRPPAVSQPLAKLWVPEYIKHLVGVEIGDVEDLGQAEVNNWSSAQNLVV